ncbi:MAG: ATP-binding cassette domain-containing protein [Candidatus Saccharimonadia bacterium]
MANAWEVHNLVKHFGDVKALDGVTLSAEEGTIFGLLGPNGAGKTTLVRMLATLRVPASGSISVLGVDAIRYPSRVRELIGLAGQYAAVDEFLTGYENIYFTGLLYHLTRAEAHKRTVELLDRLDLTDAAGRQVRTYSGGMRRRLDLGASLVGHPKILYLDEPSTGLDPQTRLGLWDIMRELVAEGTSILLTTQYLEEADELADQIAVVNIGKIIAEGTSDELKAQLGGDVVEFEVSAERYIKPAVAAVAKHGHQPPSVDEEKFIIRVPVADGSKSLMNVVSELNNANISVESLSLHRPSLDDVFLALTADGAKPMPKPPVVHPEEPDEQQQAPPRPKPPTQRPKPRGIVHL